MTAMRDYQKSRPPADTSGWITPSDRKGVRHVALACCGGAAVDELWYSIFRADVPASDDYAHRRASYHGGARRDRRGGGTTRGRSIAGRKGTAKPNTATACAPATA